MNDVAESALYNVCGVLVHVQPNQLTTTRSRLQAIPGLEIHAASEAGKLVVTLESDDMRQAGDALADLQAVPGVLSASLIYHHCDEKEVASNPG